MNYYYKVVYVNGIYVVYIANKLVPNFEVFVDCCDADNLCLNTTEDVVTALNLDPVLVQELYISELVKLQK